MRIGRPSPAVVALASSLPLLAASGCGSSEVQAVEVEKSHIQFVDVAAAAGIDVVNVSGDPRRWYIPESNGCGAAWLDFDEDGDMDLFVANGASVKYVDDGKRLEIGHDAASRLYRNDGALHFTDVTKLFQAERTEWINAVAVGDVDNDGDPDLYLACLGDDVFLEKQVAAFVERTEAAGLANPYWGTGAAFADVNRDGNLDLYVSNYCLFDPENPPLGGRRNTIEGVEVAWGPEGENGRGINPGARDLFFLGGGDGTFQEATRNAGLELEKALCSYAVVFSDVNDDGWQDILVANDLQPANLFMNQRDGTFVDEALERGFAYDADGEPTSAMGLFVEDVDQDGDFDVLRTNFDSEPNSLHINDGLGRFTEQAATFGLAEPSWDRLGWGGGFFDADLDGDFDLLVTNGHVFPQAEQIGMHPWAQQCQLFEGIRHRRRGVTWREITQSAGPGLAPAHSSRGAALADADDDGDVDALIIDIDGPPRLLENQSLRHGRWIAVRLVGEWSNHDGYGAKVTVKAGGRQWVREMRTTNGLYSAHDPRLHFGLGSVDRVDEVEVRWPDGATQVVTRPPLDLLLTIHENTASR